MAHRRDRAGRLVGRRCRRGCDLGLGLDDGGVALWLPRGDPARRRVSPLLPGSARAGPPGDGVPGARDRPRSFSPAPAARRGDAAPVGPRAGARADAGRHRADPPARRAARPGRADRRGVRSEEARPAVAPLTFAGVAPGNRSDMHWIWLILVGAIVGALGRLLHPGRDPMGWIVTILIGIVSLVVAGLIFNGFWAFVVGVIVAIVLVALVGRFFGERRRGVLST